MIFKKKRFFLSKSEFIQLSYFFRIGDSIISNDGYKHRAQGIGIGYSNVGLGQMFLKTYHNFIVLVVSDYIDNNFINALHPVNVRIREELEKVEVTLENEEFFFKKLINLKNNFPRKITYHFVNKEQKTIYFSKNGFFEKFEERDPEGKLVNTNFATREIEEERRVRI